MRDEVCAVCSTNRSDHGDKRHVFNLDGQLIPIKAKPKASAQTSFRVSPEQTMAARLAARLHARGILDDDDLVYVLNGGADGVNGSTRLSAGGDIPVGSEATSN